MSKSEMSEKPGYEFYDQLPECAFDGCSKTANVDFTGIKVCPRHAKDVLVMHLPKDYYVENDQLIKRHKEE